MSSTAVCATSGGGSGPLSLMSCVRESSPQESVAELETDRNGGSKKTFWKFTRWFKRKSNKVGEEVGPSVEPPAPLDSHPKEAARSRSTSELSDSEEPVRRKSGTMHQGLSVSHDSIFHSPQSGSDLELDTAQSSSSLYIQQPTQTELRLHSELSERLRLRRGRGDTSEDDEGLPRSPCNSPTATESLLDKVPIKDHATKSHSTCSDGSLLSMGSSDTEEDSFGLQSSRHSSKVSLHDKKSSEQDSDLELGLSSASTPLNHAAAHHRVAVRPKRTHGAPRRRKIQQLAGTTLPTTPEVNEESSAIRSLTPETTREIVRELSASMSMSKSRAQISDETRLKCSSLPPGLARPEDMTKLSRSQSSAGSKSQNPISAVDEGEEKEEKGHSIFGRFFPRRSAKKKKSTKQEAISVTSSSSAEILSETTSSKITEMNSSHVMSEMRSSQQISESIFTQKPMLLPRAGAAARQRVQPIDIPASPDTRHSTDAPRASPEKMVGTSPLHLELENRFKNHLITIPANDSKPPLPPSDSPQSPKLFRLPVESPKLESLHHVKTTNIRHFETKEENKVRHFEIKEEIKTRHFETRDEHRHRAKIAGLSSLQQRVMHHNDDSDEVGFKSLTDLPSNEPAERMPVAKSHSFKSSKSLASNKDNIDLKENLYRFVASVTAGKETEVKKMDMETKQEITETFTTKQESKEDKKESSEINKNEMLSDSNDSLTSVNSTKTNSTEFLDSLSPSNDVTICGPSHTAVITVCNSSESDSQPFNVKMGKEDVKEKMETVKQTKEQIREYNSDADLLIKERNVQEQTIVKEQQISVTKIHVKHLNTKPSVPEFLNIQLNKVDPKPAKNVVLMANLHSPKITSPEEDARLRNLTPFEATFAKEPPSPKLEIKRRRFSRDEIEIFEKEPTAQDETNNRSPIASITTPSPPISNRLYKKNSDNGFHYPQVRKSSVVSPLQESKGKLTLKAKSNSLEIVDCIKKSPDDSENKSLQNSLDNLDGNRSEVSSRTSSASSLQNSVASDGITYRRKSLNRQKKDDEPELMKVFARRSLKIKDEDQEALQKDIEKHKKEESSDTNSYKSRDSDKENQSDSPSERKKFPPKDKDTGRLPEIEKAKEPLTESKVVLPGKDLNKAKETEKIKDPVQDSKFSLEATEVVLRKPFNNKFSGFPRSTSLNMPKPQDPVAQVQKHSSFAEKPKTEKIESSGKNWNNLRKQELELKEAVFENIVQTDVIGDISPKSDFVNEDLPTIPKNFIQRKAEWEKRAQEALKKTAP